MKLALCLSLAASAAAFSMHKPRTIRNSRRLQATTETITLPRAIEKDGDFRVEKVMPDTAKPQGCLVFLHGFSQYPVAYLDSLKAVADESNVAILAIETGITDLLGDDSGIKDQQLALQTILVQDTEACIDLLQANDERLADIPSNLPLGLAGHSMGGGLCYVVAEKYKIDYVFTMAPYPGKISPYDALKKFVPENAMNVAGSCDQIAKAAKVQELSKASKAIYAEIDQAFHTSFEDRLVLTNIPLTSIVSVLSLWWSFLEPVAWILRLFRLIRTRPLDEARALMAYTAKQMVKKQPISIAGAQEALGDDDKDVKFVANLVPEPAFS